MNRNEIISTDAAERTEARVLIRPNWCTIPVDIRVEPDCLGPDNHCCKALKRHRTEQVVNRYLTAMLHFMRNCNLKFPSLSSFEVAGPELMPSSRTIIMSNQ